MARAASACGSKPEPRRKLERQRHAERRPPRRAAADRKSRHAASSAWPNVWPRLSSARSPVSRSSRATIAALARQRPRWRARAPAPPANTSRQLASSQAKKRRVAEQAVFGDLGIAGAKFARRQRVERRGVGKHQDRLMERADQVLAVGGIDRGLAADRGIDLRQQRGRHLHIVEAAPHHRRGKAGEIADDAAAERDHQIAALDARRDDRLATCSNTRKLFDASPAGRSTAAMPMPGRAAPTSAAARGGARRFRR